MADGTRNEVEHGTGENSNSGNATSGNADGSRNPVRGLETGRPIAIDPATIGQTASGSDGEKTGRRKRGRPSRSETASAAPQETFALDASGLEKLLLSMHMMMAGVFKSPGLLLTEAEAKALSSAALDVQRHYPSFQAAQKTIDWINLCTAMTMIYGTRIMAAGKAKRDARAKSLDENGKVIYGGFPGGPPPREAPPFANEPTQ